MSCEDGDAIFKQFHMGFILLPFGGVELENVDPTHGTSEHSGAVVVPAMQRNCSVAYRNRVVSGLPQIDCRLLEHLTWNLKQGRRHFMSNTVYDQYLQNLFGNSLVHNA